MIKAVIFDMDGVLTNSEETSIEPLISAGRRQGAELTPEFLRLGTGMTFAAARPYYEKSYPMVDVDQLRDDFFTCMIEYARQGKMGLMKGVLEALQFLDQINIPYAIASSSPLRVVEGYLRVFDIYDRFQVIVTGDMIKKSKPEPDIFLAAAERLHIAPKNCLVVEDSYNGIRAGRAAQMQVVMVPDQLPYTAECAPFVDHVLTDLTRLKELF